MDIANRFKQIRLSVGLTQPAMSEHIGLSRNAWQSYELGKSIPGTGVYQALVRMGFSVDWVLSGFGSMRLADTANGLDHYSFLPLYSSLDCQEEDRTACPGPCDWVAFKNEWLRLVLHAPPASLAIHLANSDSMSPAINIGDMLLVDYSRRSIRGDGVYLFTLGFSHIVKRVQVLIDGSMKIVSDNSAYPSQVMSAEEAGTLVVAGRIVWFGKGV